MSTLTSFVGPMEWPSPIWKVSGNPGRLIDASGEKVAFSVVAPKDGTINTVTFRTASVTTGDTLKVSFQGIDATTGDPDGSAAQYRTIVVANTDDNLFLTTGLMTSDGTDTGTKRTVTRGDKFFVVIEFNSYVAGNLSILDSSQTTATGIESYCDHYTTAWAKFSTVMCGYLTYSDSSVEVGASFLPGANSSGPSINTGTTPDEWGMIFQVPVQVKVAGAVVEVDLDGDADIVLYDSDGTSVLASVSYDKDIRQSTGVLGVAVWFTSLITLAADTNYRLVIKPTSATSLGGRYADTPAGCPGLPGSTTTHLTTRTDAGAWSQDNTKRPRMSILIDSVHDGSGGGGGGPLVGGRLVT